MTGPLLLDAWPRVLEASLRHLVALDMAGAITDEHADELRFLGRQGDFIAHARRERIPAERIIWRRRAMLRVLRMAEAAATPAQDERERLQDEVADMLAELAERRAGGLVCWFYDPDTGTSIPPLEASA